MAVSLKYGNYIHSRTWKRKSAEVKARAGGHCEHCGRQGPLHTHHKTYTHLGRERDGELIALCPRCHGLEHGIYDEDALLDTFEIENKQAVGVKFAAQRKANFMTTPSLEQSKQEPGSMLDFNSRQSGGRLAFLLDAAIVAERAKDAPRAYLGASRIGENCLRKLQYEYFNTPKDFPFEGKTLRIFQRGHEGEAWMAQWLRAAGFDLRTERDGGGQFGFAVLDGRVRGHADGVFVGGPGDFGPWPRLWENKVLGAKGFGKLEKERLKKAYPVYYAQIQLYMAYFQLTENPALFTAVNANDMDIYSEDVDFDAGNAQEMSDRAVLVVRACEAGEMLPRVAQREDWFECVWCSFKKRCWSQS